MSAELALTLSLLIFASMWATWVLGFRAGYCQACDDAAKRIRERMLKEVDDER